MPQNDGEVRVEITGDNSKLKKELKNTETAVKNTTDSVSKMTDALEDTSGARDNFDDIAKSAKETKKAVFNMSTTASESFENLTENAKDAEVAVADVTNEADNLGDSIEDAGQKTVTFGDLLKANLLSDYIQKGIGKLTDGFTDFIKQGVSLASDLQEVQNVVDTTFGDGAEQIYQWADAAAESFGMSSLQAQNFNGTLGAMLKSMGLTDDVVLKMSTDMVGLAGDMASFYNLDVDLAFEKIRAGISGETEPLKQLGINMSVANLEAYALAQGIETAYDKMSQSEQAILRYNYLMSVTADAQGDFAKTSDSFANQQRILELQTQNLAASLGEKLLPSLNNVLQTANDKLPKLENTAENIGELIGNITEFALENHEAILSLITAYGTFYGVMKAGNAVNTAVTAIKSLTTATQAAETAQHGMNAAAAANPYVLLASAIAAVTVGLIAYANSVDSVGNSIKNVNKNVEELQKNTEENIDSIDGEIAVFKTKAEEYENLRTAAHRTAEEEETLKRLAGELQQYMPEGTQLIDEQTGAYNSLAGSIDSVAEAMRRKATIAAYEEEYTGLIKQQLEAQKNLEDAQKEYDDYFNNRKTGFGFEFGGNNKALALKNQLTEAETAVDNIDNQLYELDDKINALYEQEPKQQISTGETYADYMQRIGKEQLEEDKLRRAEDLADYENNLKAKADELDKSLTLRNISEDEYYQQLGEYLAQNRNLESDEYYKQLDKYNNYLDKKQDAADRAAEQQLKAEKSAAEKRQKEADAAAKKAQQEAEAAAKKAQQDAEKLLSEQEKTVEKSLSNILKHFQEAYNELEKKRENYKKKLLSIGGDIFSVEEIENPDGTKVKQYTVNNINEQIKAMRQYNADIAKLKKQGASSALLEELTSLSDSDSQQFAKNLSGMSAAEFAKINEAYAEKQRIADELSKELYADEYASIADGINTALDEVSEGAADKGKAAAESYAKAFGNTLLKHSEDFYPLLGDEKYIKWFGASGDTPNIFDGMSGNMGRLMKLFTGANFADIAAKVTSTVRSEQARYSAPAYTASVANTAPDTASETDGKRKSDIAAILEKLNKPLPIMLDGKKIAEAVLTYQSNYMRKTGG